MSSPKSVVLRLKLAARAGGDFVVHASTPTDADDRDDEVLALPPTDFGIPDRIERNQVDDSQFRIPALLEERLRRTIDADDPEVLWLQLAEPFGYLALVPWERLLRDVFDVTVVRLPTLTLSRRTPHDSLQVAILVAVPDPNRPGTVKTALHGTGAAAATIIPRTEPSGRKAQAVASSADADGGRQQRPRPGAAPTALEVDRLVNAVLRGSPRRRTTVHVITTLWTYHELRKLWHGRKWDNVELHDPRVLRKKVQAELSSTDTVQTPWLRLLKAAQEGEQADVVHIISHAHVTDTKTRLVLADPMKRSTNVSSRFVSLPALMSALDDLGAWSLCLTSPSGSAMTAQMRYVGCRMAELRPGPILVTDLEADPGCVEVETGYRFLYSHDRHVPPPTLTRGMLVCEPARAAATLTQAVSLTEQITQNPSAVPQGAAATLMAAENTPIWLAAAQRFVERRQIELSRYRRSAQSGQSPETLAIARGVETALAVIQKTLDSSARALLEGEARE